MIGITELHPSPALAEYVRYYHYMDLQLGSERMFKPLTARPEQMLQFSLRQPFTVIDHDSGTGSGAPDIVVVGRQTRRNLDLLATGELILFTVHFQPAGFYRLFHMPVAHVTDLSPDAVDVLGVDVRVLHGRLMECGRPEEMVGHVERYLCSRIDDSRPLHPVQVAAAALLHRRSATMLRTLAEESDLSVRQFERAFVQQVGVGPKRFSRIVRFAAALQTKSDHPERSWADVAADAGYFDQTHLIRDCRDFGSDTPVSLMETWMDCRP